MRYIIFLVALLSFFSCKKEDPECNCRSFQDCINGTCITPPNTFGLGPDFAWQGFNLYRGVFENPVCEGIDTILFDFQPNEEFAAKYFNPNTGQVNSLIPFLLDHPTDNEYLFWLSGPLCDYNGEGIDIYANMEVKGDSIPTVLEFFIGTPNQTQTIETINIVFRK